MTNKTYFNGIMCGLCCIKPCRAFLLKEIRLRTFRVKEGCDMQHRALPDIHCRNKKSCDLVTLNKTLAH